MTYQKTINNSQQASEEPLYNIGVVSRMTEIPVATLRVWERRYDFPASSRTAGGHRLYSEKEIIRLRWVKKRIDEGMQTGRAVRALQHLEQDGDLPDGILTTSTKPVQLPRPSPDPAPGESSLTTFRDRLVEALLGHDLATANQILGDTLALYSMEALLSEVIQPTLVAIGDAWHNGQINVGTEHLASNFLRNRLLNWLAAGPPSYDVPPVVLACAPDEWHELTLLMTGVLLRRQRWPVAYLGQALPLEDLETFIDETRPQIVVLVAMTSQSAHNLSTWPDYLPDVYTNKRPLLCYAGWIFAAEPEWQERVPGLYLGNTVKEGIATLVRHLEDIYNI